ncbi:Myc-type, basic helix-loop-helix (bHLH) domain-containing protein [Artemisia annua]|uniref:Myc-type, basic helix-loop-helix (BHLH) domain-containing protein n=1 Tax=Artemisia annua TaxID=35608 RepID=A0A2U1LNN8_ARTAN|nr:Myc-type, basic helix-loop-helix (bHLH) domain-containing protein [Artemisia annua]
MVGRSQVSGSDGSKLELEKEIKTQVVKAIFLAIDVMFHAIRKACEKLADMPFYLPLYYGVHGEVTMSGQPSWSHDTIGTQVLIPVNGGLLELYISKQVPTDKEMIETLTAQFNALSKDEWLCDTKTAAQDMVHLKTEGSPNGEGLWCRPFTSSVNEMGNVRLLCK